MNSKPIPYAADGQTTVARGTTMGLLVVAFAAVKLGAHLATIAATPYGVHRDEFLYLAMGDHLRFLRMDFPPFIAIAAQPSAALRCA